MSKLGVFSIPYFPVFVLNMEIYLVNLGIQSKNGKIQTRKTPYLNTIHVVLVIVLDYCMCQCFTSFIEILREIFGLSPKNDKSSL